MLVVARCARLAGLIMFCNQILLESATDGQSVVKTPRKTHSYYADKDPWSTANRFSFWLFESSIKEIMAIQDRIRTHPVAFLLWMMKHTHTQTVVVLVGNDEGERCHQELTLQFQGRLLVKCDMFSFTQTYQKTLFLSLRMVENS